MTKRHAALDHIPFSWHCRNAGESVRSIGVEHASGSTQIYALIAGSQDRFLRALFASPCTLACVCLFGRVSADLVADEVYSAVAHCAFSAAGARTFHRNTALALPGALAVPLTAGRAMRPDQLAMLPCLCDASERTHNVSTWHALLANSATVAYDVHTSTDINQLDDLHVCARARATSMCADRLALFLDVPHLTRKVA